MYLDSIRPVVIQTVATTFATTTEFPLTLIKAISSTTTTESIPYEARVTTESIPYEARASFAVASNDSEIFALIMGIITLILLVSWIVYNVVKYRTRFIAAARELCRPRDLAVPMCPAVGGQSNDVGTPPSITDVTVGDLISVVTPAIERRYLPVPVPR